MIHIIIKVCLFNTQIIITTFSDPLIKSIATVVTMVDLLAVMMYNYIRVNAQSVYIPENADLVSASDWE